MSHHVLTQRKLLHDSKKKAKQNKTKLKTKTMTKTPHLEGAFLSVSFNHLQTGNHILFSSHLLSQRPRNTYISLLGVLRNKA